MSDIGLPTGGGPIPSAPNVASPLIKESVGLVFGELPQGLEIGGLLAVKKKAPLGAKETPKRLSVSRSEAPKQGRRRNIKVAVVGGDGYAVRFQPLQHFEVVPPG